MSINKAVLGRGASAALAGLMSGYAALALAELIAAWVRPEAGPVTAVGARSSTASPTGVKDWAIRNFGTNDKLVLQAGILVVIALLAMALGVLALRMRRAGAAGVVLFGVVGAVAALNRPDSASLTDALPSLAGGVAGGALLYFLSGLLVARTEHEATAVGKGGWNRRRFLLAAGAAAAAGTGAGLVGRALSSSRSGDAVASRAAVTPPRPSSPAPAVPRGAALRVPGISAFVTPNKDFYRVDTALVVPKVSADSWRLRIHGRGVTPGVGDLHRGVALPGAHRARRHADLRLQRGRRPVRGERQVARSPARGPSHRGGRPAPVPGRTG